MEAARGLAQRGRGATDRAWHNHRRHRQGNDYYRGWDIAEKVVDTGGQGADKEKEKERARVQVRVRVREQGRGVQRAVL